MEPITGVSLWELFKHLKQWLANLKRAGDQRKRQSVNALRSVIIAARNTAAYIRQINESGAQCYTTEARLSEQWTRLGFELTDLGLDKLAKRCEIKGRYWADPNQFDDSFLEKADISLVRMEQLARQMVSEIER
ncbi:hypothetical protein Q3O59_06850 [Alkalimonas delamerensis]|uniref:Uncharacterized protein n=1 Tax=Alkalimonas delamerensis TaxID=265981 RepID=A0ABT9GP56_9GAMM|nr:hypothetical protein [Alkalimonas delamerensis]MDP4528750.1 hypothetical protein [Alkalimonas delamerensis]